MPPVESWVSTEEISVHVKVRSNTLLGLNGQDTSDELYYPSEHVEIYVIPV